jgi:DNA-binding HxlR family transcriptional regulator
MYNIATCKGQSMQDIPTPGKCPERERLCVATAAQIISAKWTPQLIYALANDVRRFGELQKLVGLNPRTLSARLDELEQAGIVAKAAFAEVPPRIEYTLTQKGHDLFPILQQMVEWGSKYASADAEAIPEPEPAVR